MSPAVGARDGKDTSGTVASQQEGHGFQSHSGLFFVFSPCVGVAYGSSISTLGLTDNSEPRIGASLLSAVCLPAINGRLVVGVSPPSPLRPLGQPPASAQHQPCRSGDRKWVAVFFLMSVCSVSAAC